MDQKRKIEDFYTLQRKSHRKSLLLIAPLFLVYFFGFYMLAVILLFPFLLFTENPIHFLISFQLLVSLFFLALLVVLVHYDQARRLGAEYIRNQLNALSPDPEDRYHQQFLNLLEEMRIAAGLPAVRGYVLGSPAINSMALAEKDGIPSILISEGLLAEGIREELQTAIAHELAHLIRGDTFYISFLCSLASPFEWLKEALESDLPSGAWDDTEGGHAASMLIHGVAALSIGVLNLGTLFISRQRESQADALAVELTRNPMALARVIYKAHLRYSFLGSFSPAYGPLFIVCPDSDDNQERGLFATLFSSHPPLTERVRTLAGMDGKMFPDVVRQIWEQEERREKSLTPVDVFHPLPEEKNQDENPTTEDKKIWMLRDMQGLWQGPYPLEQLIFLPGFFPRIQIKNLKTGIETEARHFTPIKNALGRLPARGSKELSTSPGCPQCRIALKKTTLEGVPLWQCTRCGGRLVHSQSVERILVRRELSYSEALVQKATDFKNQFLQNPLRHSNTRRAEATLLCPVCNLALYKRPFSYTYFLPVSKCLSCGYQWFEADQLEILQILIEKKQGIS
jgi:Zn-dependent protease with chaperone function/Zn-finger nucleic acid-binding protein